MIVANKQNTKLYLEAYQETEIKIESGINDSGELLIDQNGNELTNQGEQFIYACSLEQGFTDTKRLLMYDDSDPPQFCMVGGLFNSTLGEEDLLWGSMYAKAGKTISYEIDAYKEISSNYIETAGNYVFTFSTFLSTSHTIHRLVVNGEEVDADSVSGSTVSVATSDIKRKYNLTCSVIYHSNIGSLLGNEITLKYLQPLQSEITAIDPNIHKQIISYTEFTNSPNITYKDYRISGQKIPDKRAISQDPSFEFTYWVSENNSNRDDLISSRLEEYIPNGIFRLILKTDDYIEYWTNCRINTEPTITVKDSETTYKYTIEYENVYKY